MFTGIVTALGVFKGYSLGRREIRLEAPDIASRMGRGSSLSVNGACLSLVRTEGRLLVFDLSKETLDRTNLGSLRPGNRLNLELPLSAESLLDGHIVQGHVDTVGKALRWTNRPPGKRLSVSFPPEGRPFFVLKGSVAVNGVSLTVAGIDSAAFETELIPLTLQGSNLGDLKPGDPVNLEYDILGKYVYNWLSHREKSASRENLPDKISDPAGSTPWTKKLK